MELQKQQQRCKRVRRGHTAFEAILVLAVIAGLAGTVTAGVISFRQGSARSKCISQIASVQRAVRAYQVNNDIEPGVEITKSELIGKGRLFVKEPCCPATGENYIWGEKFPAHGSPLIRCPHSVDNGHAPSTTANW